MTHFSTPYSQDELNGGLLGACLASAPEAIHQFLAMGANPQAFDPNFSGLNPLMMCARVACVPGILALLPHSDPLAVDEQGWTALMHATRGASTESVALLLPVSDPLARDRFTLTALHYAASANRHQHLGMLLKESPPDLADSLGTTPLMTAASEGFFDCVRELLRDSRCDPDLRDARGRNALMIACAAKNAAGALACARALLPLTKSLGPDGHGNDALANAAMDPTGACLRLLLGDPRSDALDFQSARDLASKLSLSVVTRIFDKEQAQREAGALRQSLPKRARASRSQSSPGAPLASLPKPRL